MRARLVAARDKGRGLGLNGFQRGDNIFRAFDGGRISSRPHQHKVIIHDVKTLHAKTLSEKLFFRRFGMNENNIRIAAPCCVERLACALRNHFHINAGLGFEGGQQMIEESRILRRCGRGNGDGLVLRLRAKSQARNGQS
jgi:hypothetical protein